MLLLPLFLLCTSLVMALSPPSQVQRQEDQAQHDKSKLSQQSINKFASYLRPNRPFHQTAVKQHAPPKRGKEIQVQNEKYKPQLPVQPVGPYSIAVCSGTSLNITPSAQKIFENHRQYGAKHNYTYILQRDPLNDEQGNIVDKYWTKIHLIKRLLQPPHTFDWVFWLDSDAIVINMHISIEHLLGDPSNHVVLMSTTSSVSTKDASGKSNNSNPRPLTSVIFSGDTNAINDGVLLFRRTDHSLHLLNEVTQIGKNLEMAGLKIAMGADNAAFSIYLGGCTSTMLTSLYQACFDRVDLGYDRASFRENKGVKRRICAADSSIYAQMIPSHILAHLTPFRQAAFQAYTEETASFVFHLPGPKPNKIEKIVAILDSLPK